MILGKRRCNYAPHLPKMLLLACGFIAIACLLLLFGCKESDAIVERIYDQSSPNVDFDNPHKLYIPDEEAPETEQDQQPQLEDVPWEDVVERDLPNQEGTVDETPIPQTEFNRQGTANASAPHAEPGGGTWRPDLSGGSAEAETQTATQVDDGGQKDDGNWGSPTDNPGTEQGIKPADPNDDSYLERVYDSTYGDVDDLPTDVSTVAAIGELATIAQIVGDDGVLIGSSEEYLKRQCVQDVFAGKGIADVKALWAGNGAETTRADAEAIIKANPDACLVYSGQLSSKLERLISQNCPDMRIVTLPKPTSAKNIAVEFQSIARMLTETTDGTSEQRAQEYLDFVENIVDEAEAAHGGGVVTYASVDYDNNDSTRILQASNPSGAQLWSLYIDGWDEDATATAKYESAVLFEDTGVAYTHTGWAWSPLSYYMSVGGVINNAAAYGPLSTQAIQPVLTLNQNQVSYTWKNLDITVDETRGGGGYARYRAFYTLTNARDAVDRGSNNPDDLHALGSSDFDTIIVKTARIAQALESARQNTNGLYTLYNYETTMSGSGYGRKYEGKHGQSIIYSTVKGDVGYRIVVNPCGYVGSWTDGSIEAPLEALWIANQFWGYDSDRLRSRIAEFYATFYDGYVPNVDEILDGSYAQDE